VSWENGDPLKWEPRVPIFWEYGGDPGPYFFWKMGTPAWVPIFVIMETPHLTDIKTNETMWLELL